MYTSADNQISHHSLMCFFMIMSVASFRTEFQCRRQDFIKVVVHQLTFINRNDRHKPALLMHPQCHRTVFHLIPESIFHLITVSVLTWSGLDRPYIITFDILLV